MCRLHGFARDAISDLARETTLLVWATLIHSSEYGVMMIVFNTSLMLQLERDFAVLRSLQGILTLVSVLGSLSVFHYSGKLRGGIGHLGMIQSAIIAAALRGGLTKLVCSGAVADGSRATWLLVLQLLHGYHFAADWVASTELVDALTSRRLRSTMQFLLHIVYFTVGVGVGNLWFGVAHEQQRGQATYSRGLC